MGRNKPGNRDQDRQDELLQELDQLQSFEPSPDIEPPRMVDQAVRNMARRELQQQPAAPLAGKLRWIAGLSTVSVALIAVGISMVQSPPSPPDLSPSAVPSLRSEKQETRPERPLESSRAKERNAVPTAPSSGRSADRRMESDQSVSAPTANADSPQAPLQLNKQSDEAAMTESSQDALSAADLNESALEESFDDKDEARAKSANTESASIESASIESARAWLDLIQQLYDQGLLGEATEQLRAFQADYPEYPLPEWAEELLP